MFCDLEKEAASWQAIDKDVVASTGKGWKSLFRLLRETVPSSGGLWTTATSPD
jgi:hypothetical protein